MPNAGNRLTPRCPRWQDLIQLSLMGSIALTTAHSYRHTLWAITPDYMWVGGGRSSIFSEFRGIVFFLSDYFLVALLMFSAARLIVDPGYRTRLSDTSHFILRGGGKWWIMLAVWMSASALWADYPSLVRYSALHFFALLAMGIILADTIRRGMGRELLVIVVIGISAQGMLAIAQLLNRGPLGLTWMGEQDWWWWSYDLTQPIPDVVTRPVEAIRATGLSVNPNNLAGYLVIGLFAGLMLLRMWEETRQAANWSLFGVLLAGLGLLATLSRSALLGAGVALGVMMLILPRARLGVSRAAILLAAGLVIAVIIAGVVISGDTLWARLSALSEPSKANSGLLNRDFAWDDTRPIIKDSPLLGVGANNLLLAIGQRNPQVSRLLLPVHNAYLMIWAELGLVGLILFGAGALSSLRYLLPRYGVDGATWACCWLAICIIMLLDYYFWGDYPSRTLLLWCLGIGRGYYLLRKEGDADRAEGLKTS